MTSVSFPLRIGELARHTGVPVKTLRYYEDLGLLPAAERSSGGFRLFGPDALQRLAFIRRLKHLGLSLEEIRLCLAVHDQGRLPCQDIQQQLIRQIAQVDTRLQELQQLKQELQTLLSHWDSQPVADNNVICPNLQV